MVVVELALGVLQVEVVDARLGPRQVGQPLEVGARDRVLRLARLHVAHALELAVGGLLRLLGQVRVLESALELLDAALVVVLVAELFLDGLELLAQVVLALRLAHLALDLRVDLVAELHHLELARQQLEHALQADLEVHRLEDVLLLLDGGVDVGGDQVCQMSRGLDALEQLLGHHRDLRQHVDDLARRVLQVERERLDLDVAAALVEQRRDARGEEGLLLGDLVDAEARDALDHDVEAVLAGARQLDDARGRADLVQVVLRGIVDLGGALRDDAEQRVLARRLLDEADGLGATDGQRHDGAREEHAVAQRQDGQLARQILRLEFWALTLSRGHTVSVSPGLAGRPLARMA